MKGLHTPRAVKQTPDGTIIVKSSAVRGMRQMRCPYCHNMAGPVRNHSGKPVIQCGSCGRQFTATRM
jgi:hypothetical protein